MNVYKIKLYVIDSDDIGKKEVKHLLEETRYPNHCMNPTIYNIQTRVINWTNDHPLNYNDTYKEAYEKLFHSKQHRRT